MILRCIKCEKNIESSGMFGKDGFTCLDYPNCKAHTKEVYEKVDSFSFALESDFNAGILFRPNEFAGHGFLKCETEDDVAYAAANEMLYRKVTKPIEWWEDAAEFLGNEASYSIPVFEYDEGTEMLTVSATMHRSKWIEFTSKLSK